MAVYLNTINQVPMHQQASHKCSLKRFLQDAKRAGSWSFVRRRHEGQLQCVNEHNHLNIYKDNHTHIFMVLLTSANIHTKTYTLALLTDVIRQCTGCCCCWGPAASLLQLHQLVHGAPRRNSYSEGDAFQRGSRDRQRAGCPHRQSSRVYTLCSNRNHLQ